MKKLVLAGLVAVSAFGAQITLDMSGGVNGTLQDLSGIFPEGTVTNGGITFAIAPSTGLNYWDAALSSDDPPQLAVPVNLSGVTHIYALLNSSGGVAGPPSLASVTLLADDFSTLTFNLLGDSDLRDWANGGGTNTINNTFPVLAGTYGTVNWFSGNDGGLDVRLDALVLALPSDWQSKTVQLITFEDTANAEGASQRILVSGVTADVETPEPATFGLVMGAGLVLIGLRRKN